MLLLIIVIVVVFCFFFKSSPEDLLIDFREREREGERGKERNIHAREKHP